MPSRKTVSQDKLDAVHRKVYRMFRNRSDFTGVDIGQVWTDGEETKDVSVRIHLQRKRPLAEIESAFVIPKQVDGVRIDVIEGDYQLPQDVGLNAAKQLRNPFLMGGASVSRRNGGAGTLGAIVMDRQSRQPGLLSNWHVLAGPHGQSGDAIFYPATMDADARAPRRVGMLQRATLGQKGDAAVAFLDTQSDWLPLQQDTFTEIRTVRRARLGETLSKTGRTSGTTKAKVDGNGIYRLRYEVRPGVREDRDVEGFRLVARTAGNPNNVEISAPGDSGATWLNAAEGAGVGLHFAGEVSPLAEHEFALACHLEAALDALDVDVAQFADLAASREEDVQTEYTPNPIDPWPPADPPRWPVIGPKPVPPRPQPEDPYVVTRASGQFHGAPQSATLETDDVTSRVKALFAAMKGALGQDGYGGAWLEITMPVAVLIQPQDNMRFEAEVIVARAMNAHARAQLRRPISGAELGHKGGGSFYGVCFYIDQVNRGVVK